MVLEELLTIGSPYLSNRYQKVLTKWGVLTQITRNTCGPSGIYPRSSSDSHIYK